MGWEILYLSPPPKSIRSFMELESDEARRASLTGDIQRARSLHPLGKYKEHLLVHEMMWIWWALSFCSSSGLKEPVSTEQTRSQAVGPQCHLPYVPFPSQPSADPWTTQTSHELFSLLSLVGSLLCPYLTLGRAWFLGLFLLHSLPYLWWPHFLTFKRFLCLGFPSESPKDPNLY